MWLLIALTLTFPPSTNRLWRNVNGRTIKSEVYRKWLIENMRYGLKTITGPYKLTMQCSPPDKRRRDLDNLSKSVGDLLQSIGAVSDDCNMDELHMMWKRDLAPGVYCWIQPMEET